MSRKTNPKVNVDTIRRLAKEQGISIRELEQEVGVAKGYIHNWGNHDVSYHYLKRCAETLGVDIDRLYEG